MCFIEYEDFSFTVPFETFGLLVIVVKIYSPYMTFCRYCEHADTFAYYLNPLLRPSMVKCHHVCSSPFPPFIYPVCIHVRLCIYVFMYTIYSCILMSRTC